MIAYSDTCMIRVKGESYVGLLSACYHYLVLLTLADYCMLSKHPPYVMQWICWLVVYSIYMGLMQSIIDTKNTPDDIGVDINNKKQPTLQYRYCLSTSLESFLSPNVHRRVNASLYTNVQYISLFTTSQFHGRSNIQSMAWI